jgi:NAD(P)-dependent dehydrogenase (short-subunit alcohol dehydrogenase family)
MQSIDIMKTLENKVAIITGAGSGIGEATAYLLASEGAKVIVSDINEEYGQAVVDFISNNNGKAFFIRADVSNPDDNKALVEGALKKYDSLDIAVNNAGIGGPLAPTGEYPVEGWQKVIDVNLSGVFYGMRYQIPAMEKKGGSIVNVGSILSSVGSRNSCAYVAAKHALIGLTKTAALEYAEKNIRVNCIGPAYINTPMVKNALSKMAMETITGLHPVKRLGEPEEVAELILWLASSKASFATGAYYALDGGYLAQ